MRKLLILAALLVTSNAIAQDAITATPNQDSVDEISKSASSPTVEVSSEVASVPTEVPTSKVVIYRPSALMGYGVACPVRYKGVEIVELGRGKYAEWVVPAGSYILANKTASVEVNLMPGQTKYVRCQIKTGFMTGRADFQLVDAESFAENSANYSKKEIVEFSTFDQKD